MSRRADGSRLWEAGAVREGPLEPYGVGRPGGQTARLIGFQRPRRREDDLFAPSCLGNFNQESLVGVGDKLEWERRPHPIGGSPAEITRRLGRLVVDPPDQEGEAPSRSRRSRTRPFRAPPG